MKEQQQPDAATLQLMQEFFEKHQPTKDFAKATDYYTTEQLLQVLKEAYPGLQLDEAELHKWLSEAGYHHVPLQGMKKVWLFVEEES